MQSLEAMPVGSNGAGREPFPVSVIYGDSAQTAVMEACLGVLVAAGAHIAACPMSATGFEGEAGHVGASQREARIGLPDTAVIYEAPSAAPGDAGGLMWPLHDRSFGLFAKILPCISNASLAGAKCPTVDLIVVCPPDGASAHVHESAEVADIHERWKQASRLDREIVVHYAFAFARANARKKVSCLGDRLFGWLLEDIAGAYPDVETELIEPNTGLAKLISDPGYFDVLVLPDRHADLLSNVAVQIMGSPELTPLVAVGDGGIMFSAYRSPTLPAVPRAAPNPSGLLMAGIMMLTRIGQSEVADAVYAAWLKTVEDGLFTGSLFTQEQSRQRTAADFADAVTARLGQAPAAQNWSRYAKPLAAIDVPPLSTRQREQREMVGVDVLVQWPGDNATALAQWMKQAVSGAYDLARVSNQGTEVWPAQTSKPPVSELWCCRYLAKANKQFNRAMVVELLRNLVAQGVHFVKTDGLYAPRRHSMPLANRQQ